MIVSIAIPAFNEEKSLPIVLDCINKQTYPKELMEIILVDSRSTDGTKTIMDTFKNNAVGYKDIKILFNKKRNIPAGVNLALKAYTGDAFVRIDAHAFIPEDFIEKNVKNLKDGEKISGGKRPNLIDEETPWKKTLLMAESSMFGSSIANYRRSDEKKYVDSMFHGVYCKEVYDTVGLYNEHLGRTEDNEMSYRIRKAGFKLCYDPEIVSYQYTRNTLGKLLRQKHQNGYWVGLTLGVCPQCLSLFHFVPFFFVISIIVTTILAVLGFWQGMALLWGAYLVANLAMTVLAIIQNGFHIFYLSLPVLFLLLHLSYGTGTFIGILQLPFKLRWLRGQDC